MFKSDDFIETSLRNKIGQGTYNRKIKETTRDTVAFTHYLSFDKVDASKKSRETFPTNKSSFYDPSQGITVEKSLNENMSVISGRWGHLKNFFEINKNSEVEAIKEFSAINPYLKNLFKKKSKPDINSLFLNTKERRLTNEDVTHNLKSARMRKRAISFKVELESILSLLKENIKSPTFFDEKPLFLAFTPFLADKVQIEYGNKSIIVDKSILKLFGVKSSLEKNEAVLISTDTMLAFLYGKIDYTPSKIIKLRFNPGIDAYAIPKNILSGKAQWHDIKVDIFKSTRSYKTLYILLDKYINNSLPMTRTGFYCTGSILPYFIADFYKVIPKHKYGFFLKLLNKMLQRINSGTLYLSPQTVRKLEDIIRSLKKKN